MKRASWLACALTLGNLLCGFAALVLAAQAHARPSYFRLPPELVQAAWLLFLGMLFDGLDGRVARMAKADGAFGAQLDSLADMVTFGAAPAALAWVAGVWADLPTSLLWISGALYAACTALRLARYNVTHASPRKATQGSDFEGLPSPAAAGLVGGLLLASDSLAESMAPQAQRHLLVLLPAVTAAAGLLMISRVPYLHVVSRLGGRGPAPLKGLASLGLVASLALYPAPTVTIAFAGYALAGLAWGALSQLLPRGEGEDDWTDERIPRR